MIAFEIVSDREVLLDAIGLLKANEPVAVTAEMLNLFKVYHGTSLASANFPSYVQVTATAVLDEPTSTD